VSVYRQGASAAADHIEARPNDRDSAVAAASEDADEIESHSGDSGDDDATSAPHSDTDGLPSDGDAPEASAATEADGDETPAEQVQEEEQEEEEEEEEEEEPKLKYQRLGASVTEILKTDSASCLSSHEKFLAIGTHAGFVHIVDFAGHETKRFKPHTAIVNDVSVDGAGEWVASCSDDGLVCVMNLFEPTSHKFSYHRPVKTLALHPRYREKSMLASGGQAQQFVINSKGWFAFQDNVIHAGEGPIHAVRWRGSLIAWANDVGVKLYDCETGERLTWIERPRGAPPPDQYRCTLCWQDEQTLLIGWADTVQIAIVRNPRTDPKAQAAASASASNSVEAAALGGAEAIAMATAARYAKQQKRYAQRQKPDARFIASCICDVVLDYFSNVGLFCVCCRAPQICRDCGHVPGRLHDLWPRALPGKPRYSRARD
jgi:hypothetical protein